MKNFAVFGNPIKHSLSPIIHSMFAEQLGIELNYEKCFVEVDSFTSSVKSFFDEGGQGLNVTVPFKVQAFQISNHLSERAKVAGSV
ncbi:MAG: shikimate dehydrogenase, partial [Pseudomonadota bacterium]|nr:shikimate dehydrogenase [Pseudomonadota bacterium]